MFFLIIIISVIGVIIVAFLTDDSDKKKNIIQQRIDSIGIKFTKEIKEDSLFVLGISEEERKVVIVKEDSQYVLNYEDILGVDFVVNGDMVISRSLGKMIGASAALGLAGAVLVDQKVKTKITSFYVDIRTRLLDNPSVRILPFIGDYKKANEITNVIKIIIDKVEREQDEKRFEMAQSNIAKSISNDMQTNSTESIADELVKLAALHDKGILTDEEYQLLKKKYIGL